MQAWYGTKESIHFFNKKTRSVGQDSLQVLCDRKDLVRATNDLGHALDLCFSMRHYQCSIRSKEINFCSSVTNVSIPEFVICQAILNFD